MREDKRCPSKDECIGILDFAIKLFDIFLYVVLYFCYALLVENIIRCACEPMNIN